MMADYPIQARAKSRITGSCEITFPDKAENGTTICIADESSPMNEKAWNYMIERAAVQNEDERRGG